MFTNHFKLLVEKMVFKYLCVDFDLPTRLYVCLREKGARRETNITWYGMDETLLAEKLTY